MNFRFLKTWALILALALPSTAFADGFEKGGSAYNPASPGALGGTTPAAGTFTTLKGTIGSLFGGLPQFRDTTTVPTYRAINGSNLATGNTDLGTVPAGKKWLVTEQAFRGYNPSVGTITAFMQIKVGGTYYRMFADTVLTTGTGGAIFFAQSIVLDAGESVSINCATTAGLNISGSILEFDANDTVVGTSRVLSLANGDNTIFTVPANFRAFPMQTMLHLQGLAVATVVNDSGGSLNYSMNLVRSGGAVATTNQLYPATALANDTSMSFNLGVMEEGDFLNINTSAGTAGQHAWVTYYLIPES